jgi:hypothetical protein
MSQVGHADSTMTLDIYAQLQQRVNRRHGNEIDRLMQEARTHLYRDGSGDTNQAEESNPAVVLDDVSDGASKKRRTATPEQAPQTAPLQAKATPAAPIRFSTKSFSVVCSTN